METTAVKLYSTGYREAKTYLAAALFVAGNIVLPQICHLVPQGGLRWLARYFFALGGAFEYGWRVGILTDVLSPAVNSALFGILAAAIKRKARDAAPAGGRRPLLPAVRLAGRMGLDGLGESRPAGHPHRAPRYAGTGICRIRGAQVPIT